MTTEGVSAIFRALNAAGVRFLVVGGLAVVAHGYVRFTADVDLVLDLAAENARRAIEALASLGYRPRAPVPIEQFLDPDLRASWAREKSMLVFSLQSDRFAATEVDLFLEPPFNMQQASARSVRLEVAAGVEAPFIGLDDLIAMKQKAGRPSDLDDIRRLVECRESRDNG